MVYIECVIKAMYYSHRARYFAAGTVGLVPSIPSQPSNHIQALDVTVLFGHVASTMHCACPLYDGTPQITVSLHNECRHMCTRQLATVVGHLHTLVIRKHIYYVVNPMQ